MILAGGHAPTAPRGPAEIQRKRLARTGRHDTGYKVHTSARSPAFRTQHDTTSHFTRDQQKQVSCSGRLQTSAACVLNHNAVTDLLVGKHIIDVALHGALRVLAHTKDSSTGCCQGSGPGSRRATLALLRSPRGLLLPAGNAAHAWPGPAATADPPNGGVSGLSWQIDKDAKTHTALSRVSPWAVTDRSLRSAVCLCDADTHRSNQCRLVC